VDGSSEKQDGFQRNCFGFTYLDKEGNFGPAKNLAKKQDVYKSENNNFIGETWCFISNPRPATSVRYSERASKDS
jgi:hypothetical protein